MSIGTLHGYDAKHGCQAVCPLRGLHASGSEMAAVTMALNGWRKHNLASCTGLPTIWVQNSVCMSFCRLSCGFLHGNSSGAKKAWQNLQSLNQLAMSSTNASMSICANNGLLGQCPLSSYSSHTAQRPCSSRLAISPSRPDIQIACARSASTVRASDIVAMKLRQLGEW